MASKKKGGSKALEIDFEGVESGGGQRAVPDGVYGVRVAAAPTKEEGADSGEAYLSWKFAILKGKYKGATLYDNTSLQPQALWKLKSLLEAMGEEVPDSTMRLVPSEYVDRELQVEVVNEEYNGKDRPKVTAYIVESGDADEDGESEEESEDEEDEDKPAKKKAKGKKSSDEDEDEEEESEDSEDEESEDEDEEEEKPKGKGKRALARAAAKKKASKGDDDEDEESEDEESEDEEDEDDEPKSKKKSGSSKVKKGARVSFEDDGKTVKGKVTDIDGSVATVDVKGDEWQVQLEDLTVLP